MTDPVTLTRTGNIGLICIDNPPVNALSNCSPWHAVWHSGSLDWYPAGRVRHPTDAAHHRRSKMLATKSPLFAPMRVLECIEAAAELPFLVGLKFEYEKIRACMEHPQHEALVHAFFAERKSAKLPEMGRAKPRSLAEIGVIGGGIMGAAITVAALDAGLEVIGLHFFSPANIMRLLEIVMPEKVSDETVVTGLLLAKMMRKIPVRSGVCDGFICNRMVAKYGDTRIWLPDWAVPDERPCRW